MSGPHSCCKGAGPPTGDRHTNADNSCLSLPHSVDARCITPQHPMPPVARRRHGSAGAARDATCEQLAVVPLRHVREASPADHQCDDVGMLDGPRTAVTQEKSSRSEMPRDYAVPVDSRRWFSRTTVG